MTNNPDAFLWEQAQFRHNRRFGKQEGLPGFQEALMYQQYRGGVKNSSHSRIPSFAERLRTLVSTRWPWQLISSDCKRLHHLLLQEKSC